jgi:23S rRNA (uracil1939-C5)-methyltransferase
VGRDGALGLRRAASHELVEIDECLVAHPGLSDLFGRVRLSGADEAVFRVSESTGERAAMAVSASGLTARFEGLPDDVKVGATATLHETVAGRVLRVSAASFFQSCAHSAELLVDAVCRAAGDTSSVRSWADLYAGVGLFASTLLDDVPVTAVELSASSCADARANLVDRRASIVECDVDRWAPEPVDLVVADPSRSGLGRRAVEVAVATGASTLVLVSCDAASLGRDTALLAAAGFSHVGSEVLDLFPGTPHVEVVTRFERSAC